MSRLDPPPIEVRRALPEDVPGAARSFSQSFTASVWARIGGFSAEAYLSHFVRDPREFMVVAEHPHHGIVGGCLGTMRMQQHRRGVLIGSLPRVAAALVRDALGEPRKGVELGRRLAAGLVGRVRPTASSRPVVEHVEPTWPLEIEEPGYIAAYWVAPEARGQQLAASMSEVAVETFRDQGFLWCEVHTYEDNLASQNTALRAGFRLVRREGTHLAYRRWIGEGDPGDVDVRVVADPADDPELAREWARLLAQTPDASGFHAWGWIAAHLAEIQDPRFGVVRFRGRPVAIIPLQMQRGGRLCFVAERRSNYGGPVYEPDHLRSAVAGFRALVEKCRPRVVDLQGLRERSPFRIAIGDLVLGERGGARSVNTIGCPEVSLAGGWKVVWGRHKSKHRGNWQRAEKRFERLGRLTFAEHTEAADVLGALPAAVKLYEQRWQGLNVDKAFGADALEFQRRAAAALAPEGQAILSVLELDGEAIAFSYALRVNGVSSSYTVAHDERFAPFSPGQLLLIHVLERAALRGDPMFDFSVGDETYKDVWATGRQELFRMVWGPGALRQTALDGLKARLRARPELRRLKQEGLRSLWSRQSATQSVRWHVQQLEGSGGDGLSVRPMTLAEMRSLLDDDLFRLAVDRAFRNDVLVLVRDDQGPAAVVWRVAASRRQLLTRSCVELPSDQELYLQPSPLRAGVDWQLVLPALAPGFLVSKEPLLRTVVATFEADARLQGSTG